MRHLIILLTIALSVAISSCRSSRQSNVAYTDTASVVSSATEGTHTAGDILSLLSVSREFDLSGIKIEFFPPDSAHPDSRAAPKSVTVETAKVKDTSEQAIHEQVDVDGQKTVNLSAQSHTGLEHDTKSDADFARPADWVLAVSIIGAIIIFIVTLLIKSKK